MRKEALLVGLVFTTVVAGAIALTQRAELNQEVSTVAYEPVVRPPRDMSDFEAPATTTTTTTTTTIAPVQARSTQRVTSARVSARPGPCGGLEGEIAARWPADQVAKACRVMMCESGGNPTARNSRSSASGLWQFLKSTWANYGGYAEAYLAPINIQMDGAFRLWQHSGWRPWVCR